VALVLAALPPCTLFVLAVAQGLFVPTARAAACRPSVGLTTDRAERETADALSAALDVHGIADRGATWVGKLASVGLGRRDTIIHVPATLDRTQPIELVVFMDGFGSFAELTMETRHAAAIAALDAAGANAVYVAPDAPSSRFGDRTASGPYWKQGCADRVCARGHGAPGDFVALYRDVIAHVDRITCAAEGAAPARWRRAPIGFSNGGRGVHDAIAQLAAPGSAVPLADVGLTRVVFADANYGTRWLADTWARVRALPDLVELTVLVQAGGFGRRDAGPGRGNRARAWAFARDHLGVDAAPSARSDDEIVVDRVRIRRLAFDHHGIGDRAHQAIVAPATRAVL
jgi:hypothetical protein